MKDLKQQLEDIQAEASAKMEKLFQDEFQRVFDSLVELYPKRDIKITFGNGTMIVEGFESIRRYLGFSDMYGMLQSYSDCLNLGTLDKFPKDHPLIQLMKLMDICYYPDNSAGWCLALNDINKL